MGCHNMSWSGSVLLLNSLNFYYQGHLLNNNHYHGSVHSFHILGGVRSHHGIDKRLWLGLVLSM